MTVAARKSTRLADPQSGPAANARRDRPGHFHFSLAWVVCEPGRISALAVSKYINREDGSSVGSYAGPSQKLPGWEMEAVQAERLSSYLNRGGRKAAEAELGAHVLCTQGLKVESGAELSRALDGAERKADRTYRCYGGRLPRVAAHLIASIRRGISDEQSATMLVNFVASIADFLKVPLEGRVHKVGGVPDHIHVMLGTRIVENGRIGKKQRMLDAVSQKADGQGLAVGDRLIGPTVEWMRSEWARLNREMSGDRSIDHRSYARRGMAIRPVSHVSRGDIEYERRRGTSMWRMRRANEIAMRDAAISPVVVKGDAGPALDIGRGDVDESHGLLANTGNAKREDNRDVGERDRAELIVDDRRASFLDALSKRAAALAQAMGFLPSGSQDRLSAAMIDLGIDPALAEQLNGRVRVTSINRPPRVWEHLRSMQPILGVDVNDTSKPVPDLGPDEIVSSRTFAQTTHASEASPVGVEEGVRAVADLWRRRRQSVSRIAEVAALVGIDAGDLAAMAKALAQQKKPLQISAVSNSAQLQDLRKIWAKEDNEARRTRRNNAVHGPDESSSLASVPADNVVQPIIEPNENQGPSQKLPSESADADEDREQLLVGYHDGSQSEPVLVPSEPSPSFPLHDPQIASKLAELAAVQRQTRFTAHMVELEEIARRFNKPWNAAGALNAIAFRLRAAGHERGEVAATLEACAPQGEPQERSQQILAALDRAFSSAVATKLRNYPQLITRARRTETAAGSQLYRRLRRAAMDAYKQDLAAVWAERRLRADEAARSHGERLALLHHVRRGLRRRGRHGLVLTTLSFLVEIAVIQPLIDGQKNAADRNSRELYEAAGRASQQLKQTRQEWLDVVGPNRRGLVSDVALAIAAGGKWPRDLVRPLARLINVDSHTLWNLAHHACQQKFGHNRPEGLPPAEIGAVWRQASERARRAKLIELISLMEQMNRGRTGRGE